MNFRKFLLLEELGLGDIGPKINQTFSDLDRYVGGSVSARLAEPSGALTHDIEIPSVERTGRIVSFMATKNPIYIRLSDGTEAHFTFDEYNKIQGKPALGKVMTIVFQRHPADTTKQVSKIEQAIVH